MSLCSLYPPSLGNPAVDRASGQNCSTTRNAAHRQQATTATLERPELLERNNIYPTWYYCILYECSVVGGSPLSLGRSCEGYGKLEAMLYFSKRGNPIKLVSEGVKREKDFFSSFITISRKLVERGGQK